MDEFNTNNSQDNEEQQTTPYQTPVRGASAGGAQHASGTQEDAGQETQRISSDDLEGAFGASSGTESGASSGSESSQSSDPYSQSGSAYTSNPYGQQQEKASNPYSQWGPAGGSAQGGGSKKPKKPKKHSKVKVAALGAVVVVLAFVGGMAVSGGLSGVSSMMQSSQDSSSTASGSGLPADSTKVEISNTKTTGEGENADDGKTGTEIYNTVSPSIVSIIVDDITVGSEASGSGVIMSKDGYIITNQHVVSGGNKFTVVLSDSTQYEAELIGEDEQTDLAVLKVNAKDDLTPAEFGNSDELAVGDRCYAIGSPGGVEYQNTFTGGYVSAINRDVTINDRVMTLIQTDTAINPGSSGGALINKYGQVVGITSSKLSSDSSSEASYEGMGFAIPMSTAEDIVNELIAYGHVTGRPAIGISGYNIDANAAQYYDVPQGVLVSSVDEASDAYKQGIQANDIITKVNGTEVTSMSDINAIKEELSAGDTITLTIYRSGDTKEIKVELMDESDLSNTTSSSTTDSSNDSSSSSSGQSGSTYGYGTNPFSGYGY